MERGSERRLCFSFHCFIMLIRKNTHNEATQLPLPTGHRLKLCLSLCPSPFLSLSLSANSLEFLISKFIMSSWSRTKGDDHVAREDEGDTLRQWRHKVYSCTKNTHLMEDARSSSSRRWAAGEQAGQDGDCQKG